MDCIYFIKGLKRCAPASGSYRFSFLVLQLQLVSGASLTQTDDVCFGFAARRKLLERARRAGLGGFKKRSGTEASAKEMWDGEEGEFTHGPVAQTEL